MLLWNSSNGHIYYSFELEKYIIDRWYSSCNNLKEYFFDLINSLQTYHLPQTSVNKVNKAKQIIVKVKEYEANGMPASAEEEIRKIFN